MLAEAHGVDLRHAVCADWNVGKGQPGSMAALLNASSDLLTGEHRGSTPSPWVVRGVRVLSAPPSWRRNRRQGGSFASRARGRSRKVPRRPGPLADRGTIGPLPGVFPCGRSRIRLGQEKAQVPRGERAEGTQAWRASQERFSASPISARFG